MKNGKKPTVAQCKLLEKWKLRPENWLIERDTPEEMVIVHRYVDITKSIPKKTKEETL